METNNSGLRLVTMSELQKRIFQKPMQEIVTEIEDQLLIRLKETEILQNMLKECSDYTKQGSTQNIKSNLIPASETFPGYPLNGSLIEKFEFLEQIHLRMWNKSEMEKLIIKAEGEEFAKKTLHNISQKLSALAKQCRLIKMQYGKQSRWNCFYTTRMEWIEVIKGNDTHYFSVVPKHAPDESHLKNMTPEMKHRDNIEFTGIQI